MASAGYAASLASEAVDYDTVTACRLCDHVYSVHICT